MLPLGPVSLYALGYMTWYSGSTGGAGASVAISAGYQVSTFLKLLSVRRAGCNGSFACRLLFAARSKLSLQSAVPLSDRSRFREYTTETSMIPGVSWGSFWGIHYPAHPLNLGSIHGSPLKANSASALVMEMRIEKLGHS
ncbi:hypothetical protein TWF730_003657 [Orbilia blumenaviensis]|uniref:Uncharacterized protein n=1 Tax=Orbilia blumenaviensis TaxID=1796055 RepID=A0AAV9U5G3_9PEZI